MRDLSADLLDWYDAHARTMLWRVSPADKAAGLRPDPYAVWMSEIMLQQTTVAAVTDYFQKFIARWPTVRKLAAAEDADVMAAWAGLGYYARARNLLKCARTVVADYEGAFPADHAALLKLPGIGPYTAAAIASIASLAVISFVVAPPENAPEAPTAKAPAAIALSSGASINATTSSAPKQKNR